MKISLLLFQLLSYTLIAFLQSILMSHSILFHQWVPDIAFVLFFFFAINNGPFWGTITGFVAGILIHAFMLPDSVLGLYSFFYVIIGYIAGNLRGRFIVDPLLLPLLYLLCAYLFRASLLFLFSLLPDMPISFYKGTVFFIQAGMTLLFTPLIYNFCRWTKLIDLNRREKR